VPAPFARFHARNPSLSDLGREHWTEPVPPVSHRFMADINAAGAVRPIRTRLCKDNMTALYVAPRPRHSARAAARLSLKFVRVERLRS
jgi:hypothetical protein